MLHHGEALRRLIGDDVLPSQLKEDYTQAKLSPADRAMLDFATKLTHVPAAASRGDVEALRHAGFEDRAILDITQIVAYFAFVNRLACGLGVTPEESWQAA